jgi:hypothetical protein
MRTQKDIRIRKGMMRTGMGMEKKRGVGFKLGFMFRLKGR